jgi:hypothetical protein
MSLIKISSLFQRRPQLPGPASSGPPTDPATCRWVAAAATAAADVLEDGGWTQGNYHVATGARCLVGALRWAIPELRPRNAETVLRCWVASVIATRPGDEGIRGGTLEGWNDAPWRTAEEVVAILRAVADVATATADTTTGATVTRPPSSRPRVAPPLTASQIDYELGALKRAPAVPEPESPHRELVGV